MARFFDNDPYGPGPLPGLYVCSLFWMLVCMVVVFIELIVYGILKGKYYTCSDEQLEEIKRGQEGRDCSSEREVALNALKAVEYTLYGGIGFSCSFLVVPGVIVCFASCFFCCWDVCRERCRCYRTKSETNTEERASNEK